MINRLKLIAGSMIAIGIVFTIIGFASGGRWFILVDSAGFHVPSEQSLISQSYELEAFKNIIVTNEHADIEIIQSDSFSLELSTYKMTDVMYSVKGDTLTVESNNQKNNAMTLGVGPFKTPSIKIYVPKDALLSNITLKSSFGDVNLQQLNYEQLNLDVRHGDISFNNIKAGHTEIINAFGDITLQQFTSASLIVESEHGDIEVDGELNGNTTVTSSFGDVELILVNNKENFGFKLNTSFGDITVDGEEYNGKISKLYEGDNQLEVLLSHGDLKLTLK
ncbi:DUF4097 domain-containing protein [Solibacillus sp. MA9]|uniref:DUF4097 domain-containing protein n=1 Tax=Solibacillus palustris TaxID=2908203 RepID=A0ABS9UFV2_9BACL|nr:DUF4097 family beta strand repeat-containing protein [Solibacillus sp. MA9]MCH7323255.1 DUF4097 domain-containing protein [Solibacillus sp. MA9]